MASYHTLLAWHNNANALHASPTKQWAYQIHFIKNTKQFELVLTDNYSSTNNKQSSTHASLENAIFTAQKHFDDAKLMINGSKPNPN